MFEDGGYETLSEEEMEIKHVVGLSGGKDSTALALRLKELNPDIDYTYICTPTGDELPEMIDHWENLESILEKPIVMLKNHTLNKWIQEWNAIPNHRMRWCTRVLKIQPLIAYMKANHPALNYVGLRADEEMRDGIYGDEVESVYPFREWEWGLREVIEYLRRRKVKIPKRTDCARCYHQTLGEWWDLYMEYPDIYAEAEVQEKQYGRTFRSEQRDTWPASLEGLRKEFESGRIPHDRSRNETLEMFPDDIVFTQCRVCSL